MKKSARVWMLRELSGPHQGKIHILDEDVLYVARMASGLVYVADKHADEGERLAVLRRSGSTYEIEGINNHTIRINGEAESNRVKLRDGDLVTPGADETLWRFRLFECNVLQNKSLRETFADSVVLARTNGRSSLRLTGQVISCFANDLAAQRTFWFRLSTGCLIFILGVAVAVLFVQNNQLQRQLYSESIRVQGIADLIRKSDAEMTTLTDLGEVKEELQGQLHSAAKRLASLEARFAAIGRVIETSSESIAFIQGTYGFNHATSGQPLRYVKTPVGVYLFTFDERGEVVDIPFSGTAFFVSEDQVLLTNRHIALPWTIATDLHIDPGVELRPVMHILRGFVSGEKHPFDLRHVFTSDESDLALLRPIEALEKAAPLPLASQPPTVGQEVLVMGFPLGLSGILVRAGSEFESGLRDEKSPGFIELADRLAAEGLISPLTSRGIVSQRTEHAIAYDAETTLGGSGGPVLNLDGEVVAVNTATMRNYGGSNLGVPAHDIQTLLKRFGQSAE